MSPAALAAAPPVALLAHQGGWDEIGLVAVPLVVVAALLVLANRRAKRVLAERSAIETQETADPAAETAPNASRPTGP